MDRQTLNHGDVLDWRRTATGSSFVAGALALFVGVLLAAPVGGQTPPTESPPAATPIPEPPAPVVRLLDQEPYDLLILNDKERTEERLVPLAVRKLPPVTKPDDLLRVRLKSDPAAEFDVRWGDIAAVRLFEDLVLEEANRLVAAGKFDEAFDYFIYLHRKHPSLVEVTKAEAAYVAAEARHELAQSRFEHALVLILRLREIEPRHAALAELLPPAAEGLVALRLRQREYVGARHAAAQAAALLPSHPAAIKLLDDLKKLATDRLEAAKHAAAENRFGEAQVLLAEALALAPDMKSAEQLLGELVAGHSRVTVGIVQTAPGDDDARRGIPSIDDWAARRAHRLLHVPALDPVVTENGSLRLSYADGWARWQADQRDPLHAKLLILDPASGRTAYDLAAQLTRAALDRASLAGTPLHPQIVLQPLDRTTLDLQLPHPFARPEALVARLLGDLPVGSNNFVAGAYRVAESGASQVRYVRGVVDIASGARPPAEIVERRFDDEDQAVAALLHGDVDVVDRLAPWQIAGLRKQPDVVLRRYPAMSVHCLRFNPSNPLLRRIEFRRAVVCAVDREAILRHHLQAADDDREVRTAAGLFSAGRTSDDPLGYGADPSIAARVYDPHAALLSARMATAGTDLTGTDSSGAVPPGGPLATLSLAHPATATARRACEQIRAHLARVGIEVRLVEARDGTAGDADLAYCVVSSLEPAVDAFTLLGPGGLFHDDNAEVDAKLADLAQAATFDQARTSLRELHRILHQQALLVPLWQLNEYAACRSRATIVAAGRKPTSLYQFVETWRIAPKPSHPLP